MEKRKPAVTRSSPLPSDYLKMVNEVFASNFDQPLKKISDLAKESVRFESSGAVYPEEIVLSVTLVQGENLSATTVYASSDFDPRASSPTIQELLASCLDAIGSVYQPLLNAKKEEDLENLLSTSLSALEQAPFHWTPMDVEKRRVFVKIDKSNPRLDEMADEWLRKHDPELAQQEAQDEARTENLFITGPKKSKR